MLALNLANVNMWDAGHEPRPPTSPIRLQYSVRMSHFLENNVNIIKAVIMFSLKHIW